MGVQTTYLGWEELAHRRDCKRPQWTVEVRDDSSAYRYRPRHGEPQPNHSCPDGYCDHGSKFTEQTVRIVCRSCGVVELIKGEVTEDTGRSTTSTRELGYGLAPRKVAGLFLYPGEPFLNFGRLGTNEPHDFLVTRTRVDRVTAEDVVGQIVQGRTKRRAVCWNAAAGPRTDGPFGYGDGVHFGEASDDSLRTVTAAAKWITARLAETPVAEKTTRTADRGHSADETEGGRRD